MKSLFLLLSIFVITSSNAQSIIEDWWLNTTGDTYGGTLTDVEEIWYNDNYVFLISSGIPSYFPTYASQSVYQPTDQGYTFRIQREPQEETGTKTTVFTGPVGVGLDGSPFYHTGDGKSWNGSDFLVSGDDIWHSLAWEYEGNDMDGSNGHSTASNAYHHHAPNFELFSHTDSSVHSPLIGYAFDGFPIYGPFAYTDPTDVSSTITQMTSSYQERNITDRTSLPDGTTLTNASDWGPPINSSYPLGSIEEDYEYVNGSGMLDTFNGRWCITPEYPCGTYAYFATIDGSLEPDFPYHVGFEYYGVTDFSVGNSYTNATIPGNGVLWVQGTNICETTVSGTGADPTCVGNDGSISLTSSGFGLGSTCYEWSNGETTQNISSLNTGSYKVFVTGNGCVDSVTVVLASSGGATAVRTGTDPTTCGGTDGQIQFGMPSGGTPPYTFSIDNGVTYQSTPSFTGLSAGTYITILLDNAGCSEFESVVLSGGVSPSIDQVNLVDPTCNGTSDGSIEIIASGGSSPYQYSINNGMYYQSGTTYSSLPSGTYDVVVLDNNGCTVSTTSTLTDPSAVTYNETVTDATCGGSDGSFTLSGLGGDGTYTYSNDNGVSFQASGTFGTLSGGNYNVVVEDGVGCQATGITTIGTTSAPTIVQVNVVDPTCNGDSDGSLEVNATGGSAPLQYSIDNGVTYQTGVAFTGQSAGTYDVVVLDNAGCSISTTSTLTDPIAVSYSESVTDASCGGSDGSITLSGLGGDGGAYTYSNDNGVSFQASGTFSSLSAGNYNVVVEDGSGCQATGLTTIGTTSGPTIVQVNVVDPTCNGDSDGSLEVNATGGSAPLQYSIDNGVTYQTGVAFTGQSAGTYDVVVLDNAGCSTSTTSTLTDPSAVTYNETVTDASCGGSDGSFTLSGLGGDGTYTYSNDNGVSFQAGGTFGTLSGGNYNVVVEDGVGCQATGITTIGTTSAPTIVQVNLVDPTCNGDSDGSLEVNATGGSAPLQYSIDNGVTYQTGVAFTGQSAGTYDVVVLDNAGCSTSTTSTLTDPSAVTYSESVTDASCGGSDGSFTLSGLGGDGTYTYSNDNGVSFQASGTFSSLSAGSYNVVVEDGSGCQATGTTSVNTIGGPTIDQVNETNPNCFGDTDGSIEIVVSGGTSPYQYSVDNGANFQSSATHTGLGSGMYTLLVEDASGCQATTTTNLMTPPPLSITATVTDETSPGNGAIDITVSGGAMGGYSYDWDNDGTGDNDDTEDLSTVSGAMSYTVIVTDNNGCSIDSTFFVASTVNLSNLYSDFQISIYPNPTKVRVFIESDQRIQKVQIFDLHGRLVTSQSGAIGGINVEELQSGNYILRIEAVGGEIAHTRIIKQ